MYQLPDEETTDQRNERWFWNLVGCAVVLLFGVLLAYSMYGCWR